MSDPATIRSELLTKSPIGSTTVLMTVATEKPTLWRSAAESGILDANRAVPPIPQRRTA